MTPDLLFHGGDGEDRTLDLLHAKQALSQLSYVPMTLDIHDYITGTAVCKVLSFSFSAAGRAVQAFRSARIFSAAPSTASTACSKVRLPCRYMVYGGRTGPSAEISMVEPCTKVPAAMRIGSV